MQHTHLLPEAAQDRLLIRIYEIAKTFVPRSVRGADAEDVVHDVALDCLTKLRSDELRLDEDRFDQFVRRIIRRQAIDLLRRSISREDRDGCVAMASSDPRHIWMSPALGLVDDFYEAFAQRTLARLPKDWNRAFAMTQEERLRYEQVAARLGVSRGMVHKYLAGVRAEFRKELPSIDLQLPDSRNDHRSRSRKRRRKPPRKPDANGSSDAPTPT
jgi:RNA polymerase sigma factor (sigma-70 family)